MSQPANKAIYDPNFKADKDGYVKCPSCNKKMYLTEDMSGEGWWYCINCKTWTVTQPSHHENEFLGHDSILIRPKELDACQAFIQVPSGYIEAYCPRCKKPMWVEKMWLDKSESQNDRCRLVLGYVCEDWQNCGYTQCLKAQVPTKSFDYIKD